MIKAKPIIMGLFCGLLLGCSTAPYLVKIPGQQVVLAQNEGLLALRLKFGSNIVYVEIEGRDKGTAEFKVEKPQNGFDMRILRVPAGRYCVDRFGGHGWYLHFNPIDNGVCFEVKASTLNYPGDFEENYRAIAQVMNYKGYLAQLQSEHPDLFKQFVLAE